MRDLATFPKLQPDQAQPHPRLILAHGNFFALEYTETFVVYRRELSTGDGIWSVYVRIDNPYARIRYRYFSSSAGVPVLFSQRETFVLVGPFPNRTYTPNPQGVQVWGKDSLNPLQCMIHEGVLSKRETHEEYPPWHITLDPHVTVVQQDLKGLNILRMCGLGAIFPASQTGKVTSVLRCNSHILFSVENAVNLCRNPEDYPRGQWICLWRFPEGQQVHGFFKIRNFLLCLVTGQQTAIHMLKWSL
jgi:hypothetical protein